MKRMLIVSLALILALAFCAPALAENKPIGATQAPATAKPTATTAPVVTDTPAATDSLPWGDPTPEQINEVLAVYRRFVALCQERGEIISDTAFTLNPEGVASFGLVYLPMEGVEFTGVPAGRFYYLNIEDLTGIGWERHRAFWADMVRAIDPAVDAARAARIIHTAWKELSEAHPGTGVMDGHFEEGAWGYTVIKSPDDTNGSTLMAGPRTEPVEGQLPITGPVVLHIVDPQPEDARLAQCRATFRSLVEALGMELLPDEEPVETEINGLLYSCHLVTDTVEWTDLLDPEDRKPLAHYALHKGQDTTKQGVSDLTRSVLQAAIVTVADDISGEKAAALIATLIDNLEENTKRGGLLSTTEIEGGRTVVLHAERDTWSVLISRND